MKNKSIKLFQNFNQFYDESLPTFKICAAKFKRKWTNQEKSEEKILQFAGQFKLQKLLWKKNGRQKQNIIADGCTEKLSAAVFLMFLHALSSPLLCRNSAVHAQARGAATGPGKRSPRFSARWLQARVLQSRCFE